MRKFLAALPLVLTLSACGSDSDSSAVKALQGPHYLALGDSISFGMTPLVELSRENVDSGAFVGYPESIANIFHYNLVNASCPGTSTSSMIDRTAPDNGCHSGIDPMDQWVKVPYVSSQLSFAVEFLKANADTKLVTLSLGGNDILVIEAACDLTDRPALCKATSIPKLAVTLGKNISTIVKSLKSTGYSGPIVFVTNYARDYKDPIQKLALGLIQTELYALSHFHKFKVVSGYNAFKAASKDFNGDACAAGLLIALPEGGCNQHPSVKGRELLAQTVLDAL